MGSSRWGIRGRADLSVVPTAGNRAPCSLITSSASSCGFLAPDRADQVEAAGDGPPRAAQPLGDLVGGVALHPIEGDSAGAARPRGERAAAASPRRPWPRTRASAPARPDGRGVVSLRLESPSGPECARSTRLKAPPRFRARRRSVWAEAFLAVITTSSFQRSSRSPSSVNRPRASPAQKLSKALRAASSSSSTPPVRLASRFRARRTSRSK